LVVLIVVQAHKPQPAPPTPTPATAYDNRPRPLLSISLNGTREAQVFRGWPLILEAGLFYPTDVPGKAEKKPFLIVAKDGPWSNAVHIEIRKKPGEGVTWPFHLADTPSSTFSLHAQAEGDLIWWLSPEDSAQLSEGNFEVVAVLDTTDSTVPGGWKGATTSVPVSVRLSNEPEPLTAEQESEKYQLSASYYLVRGDSKQAMAQMEALLQKQPDNVGGLEFKGDALAEGGKAAEALACYRRALDAFLRKYHTIEEPPRELWMKQHRLLDKLLHDTAEPAERGGTAAGGQDTGATRGRADGCG